MCYAIGQETLQALLPAHRPCSLQIVPLARPLVSLVQLHSTYLWCVATICPFASILAVSILKKENSSVLLSPFLRNFPVQFLGKALVDPNRGLYCVHTLLSCLEYTHPTPNQAYVLSVVVFLCKAKYLRTVI